MNNFFGVVSFNRKREYWQWGDTRVTNRIIPRFPEHNNCCGYYTSDITAADWASVLSENDQVFGGEPGEILGIKVHLQWENSDGDTKTGFYYLLSSKVWGIHPKDALLHAKLERNILRTVATFTGGGVPIMGRSIASTAMKWYTRFFDNQEVDGMHYPKMTQLPPRWRSIAVSSFHGGPIACLRGGSDHAIEIDLRGAFLHALTKPVPVVTSVRRPSHNNPDRFITEGTSYKYIPGANWDILRDEDGFVEATVLVPDECELSLPPLPIHTINGTSFPVGRFRGAWTIPLLREAEKLHNVQIEKVHQHSIAERTEPLFRHLSQVWSGMDKSVSKPLYTRFWGKFGFGGGWTAQLSSKTVDLDFDGQGQIPMDYFWWSDTTFLQTSERLLPTYRPDISAYVSSYNHILMMRAMKMLKPGSIIACHVDAIWTDDIEGAKKVIAAFKPDPYTNKGDWKIAKEGPLRFWACGLYDHDGKLGWSGYDPKKYGPPTHEKLARFVLQRENCGDTIRNRRWESKDSTISKTAKSRAMKLNHLTTTQTTEGLPITSPVFDVGGWIYKD